MNVVELLFIAVGLSMDAFAVSVCKGLSLGKARIRDACIVGLYFGVFQAGMPLFGYLLGAQFQHRIAAFDHWISFGLLVFIGAKMLYESRNGCETCDPSLKFRNMIMLAVATSIDALAVGVTFGLLEVAIVPASLIIGSVTFIICMLGVKIGNIFGEKYKSKTEFVGGLILILIGARIVADHTGVFSYLQQFLLK